MPETPGQRGTRYERELVNTLRQAGRGALRFPSSGAATNRSVPDVLTARPLTLGGAELWGIELKSGKATTLYVGKHETAKLELYANRWGATPYLGARFTTQATDRSYWLVHPDDARETDTQYGLPVADIEERATYRVVPGDDARIEIL